MKQFLTTILTVFTICSFGQTRPDPNNFFKSVDKPIWKFEADFFKGSCFYNGCYLFDSILVVKGGATEGCSEGKLYALNNKTGKIVWHTELQTFEGNYQFHSNNIIYSLGNKLVCLDIYTGKQSWIYEKSDRIIKGYNAYFLDSTIYILASNSNNPTLFHSEKDLLTTNDSLDNTELILINEKNGKELNNINNIIHKESFGIDYVNKNIIVLVSHKAITAFDIKTNQEIWRLKKAHHPKWLGYGPQSEMKDTVIQYSFIYGKGDTIVLSRKTSSIDYKIGEEKIIAFNLKSGNIIAEFFASGINDYLIQNHYVEIGVSGQKLFYIKRNNLSSAKSWNGYANYVLTCIDLKSLQQKWEYNLSQDNKGFDVRDWDSHLFIDSTAIYFTDNEKLICISPEKGELLWDKKIKNAKISNMTFTQYFIICSIYYLGNNYKDKTIILDKSNISNTANRKTEFYPFIVDNSNDIMHLVDSKDRLLKIKTK